MNSHGRIVDAWMQHPTPRFLDRPIFDSLRRWSHGGLGETGVALEATIAAMDEGGVRTGLVCAWWGPEGPLITNDEVADFVRRYPDRLVGVASVGLQRPMEAVRELRRCVRQLGIPFCLQVGHTGPLCPSEPGRPIPYLDRVALEFPELTIVGGHIGYPWTAEMIALATKYPNVYIDTSAYR